MTDGSLCGDSGGDGRQSSSDSLAIVDWGSFSVSYVDAGKESHWKAEHPQFPGLTGRGMTSDEAIARVNASANLFFDILREEGISSEEIRLSVHLRVRLSRSLHGKIISLARQKGMSINRAVNEFLLRGLLHRLREARADPASIQEIADCLGHWGVYGSGNGSRATGSSSGSRMGSGQVPQRMPGFVHRALESLSKQEGVTLNALVVEILSAQVAIQLFPK